MVCPTEELTGKNPIDREDGWSAMRIVGQLDFSLIGILAGISSVLAEQKIGIFVISTFNTDYILVKSAQLSRAVKCLSENGYEVD